MAFLPPMSSTPALREPANILLSAALVAVSAALLNPVPLFLGAVAKPPTCCSCRVPVGIGNFAHREGKAAGVCPIGEIVDKQKLLWWFGLFAIAIAVFGFGTDAMNDGLKLISDSYLPDTKLHGATGKAGRVGALMWTTGFAIWFPTGRCR